MNFSFELLGELLTGNISPEITTSMSTAFGAFFGWFTMIWMLLYVAIIVLMVISRWKIFTKAWLPGWGIFIPFYNQILKFKVWGLSGRWIILAIYSWAMSWLFWNNGSSPLSLSTKLQRERVEKLWFISFIIFVIMIIVRSFKIPLKFWKHWTFGFWFIFLPFIFIPILAFDNSKYLGRKAIAKPVLRKAPAKVIAKIPAVKTPAKKVIAKAPVKKVIITNRANKRTTKRPTTQAPDQIGAKIPTAKAPAKKVKTLKKI